MTASPPGRNSVIRWVWTGVNVALAVLAVVAMSSDVWEAFVTLFLASALLQLVWMRSALR